MRRKDRSICWRSALFLLLVFSSPALLRPTQGQIRGKSDAEIPGVPEGYTIIEGDILMPISEVNERRNRAKSKTSSPQSAYNFRGWTFGIVNFEFDGDLTGNCGTGSTSCVTAANRTLMLNAMGVIHRESNIRFQHCVNNACSGNYVRIVANPSANFSKVGMQGGRQDINIMDWGDQFVIVHELMHCLGIFHEQSRLDRDRYVEIYAHNVKPGLENNFERLDFGYFYGPYDYDSVMHYGQCSFSKNDGTLTDKGAPVPRCPNQSPMFPDGGITIKVKEPFTGLWQGSIGKLDHLSVFDRWMLKFLYPDPSWRFVDASYLSVTDDSNGFLMRPYRSLQLGINATPVGGVLWVQPGTYFANSLTKAIQIRAPLGGVDIQALRGVAGDTLASVSAASYNGELASESIAVAFGQNLASGTAYASSTPLPTTLGGVKIVVKDSAGVDRDAPLFFVSSGQVNYLVPSGVSVGPANIAVIKDGVPVASGEVAVTETAPGVFTADSSGGGPPAAVLLRVRGEEQVLEPLARYDEGLKRFVPVPIDLGPETDQVFLILFGTGFRSAPARAMIGDVSAEVVFSGGLAGLAGLDQANVRLPRSLAGKGDVRVMLTADNRAANAIMINVQ